MQDRIGAARRRDDEIGLGSSTATASNGAARPPTRSASSCALSSVRLETTTSAPRARRFRAASSLIFPAPNSSARLPSSSAELVRRELDGRGRNRLRQLRSFASVRTRFPAWSASSNSRFSSAPVAPAGAGGLVGVAHLAEDLRLARDERVEPGGDAEEMRDRLAVVPAGRATLRIRARSALQLPRAPAGVPADR